MTDTTIRARFSAKYVPILAPFIPVLDIRYYLCGINVARAEQGGVYLVATDGHMMAIIFDAEGTLEGADNVIVRVHRDMIQACRKASRKRVADDLTAHVLLEDQRLLLAPDFGMIGTDMERYVQPGRSQVAGDYPEWRRLLPDFANLKPGFNAAINAQYLARYASLTRNKYRQALSFWQEDANEVVIVQHHGIPEMISMVMPMTRESKETDHLRGLMDRYIPLRAQFLAEQKSARANLSKQDGKDAAA